jgi:hypothetical protein
MGKRLTKNEFIEKSNLIHNNKYDYSLVEYKNNYTKIKIICPIHGIFEQTPSNHIHAKQDCPMCYGNKKMTIKEFIKKSNLIHNNKYNYSLVEYKNNYTKIKIICPIHGIFEQKPINHLVQKQGCMLCAGKNKKTTEEFISASKEIHGDLYDYSLVNYINNGKNVEIICPIHGVFKQRPDSHICRGHGCPICKNSKGEQIIVKTLNDIKIDFIRQKEFDGCIDKKPLPFDFYLPKYNIYLEYDGLQHFEPVEYWGGIDTLKYIQKHDKIKNDFCKNNSIKLIRIKYTRKLNSNYILEIINNEL